MASESFDLSQLFTIEDVARELRKSTTTIRNYVSNETLKHLIPAPVRVKGVRRLYWTKESIHEAQIGQIDPSDTGIFDTKRAAQYISTTAKVLKNSRVTGKLWGYTAPEFLKAANGVVRYRKADLDKFINSLPRYGSTAEVNAALRKEAAQ